MKKVLSLAFIAAAILLGCSADGFYDEGQDINSVTWGKVCMVADNRCAPVSSKAQCDLANGRLVLRSECPD